MSRDLDLRLRLTATNKGVAGTVRNTAKEVDRYSDTVESASRSTRRASQATGGFTTAGQEATRMFKLQKNSLQQAGYQIQDFAVQVGSGTSAMVALGQQGSQLLGLIGPGGALLGSVLAIGSALYLSFGGGARAAADAADNLVDKIDDLEQAYDDLTSAQRAALLLERDTTLQQQEAAMSEIEAQIRAQESILKAFETAASGSGGTGRFAGLISDTEAEEAREEIILLSGELDTLRAKSEQTRDQYDELIFGFESGEEETKKARTQIEEMVAALEAQAAAIGETSRQTDLRVARGLNATDAQIQAIRTAYDEIEQAAALDDAQQGLDRILDKINPLGAELRNLGADIKVVQSAFAQGLITQQQADDIVNQLSMPTEKAAEEFENQFASAAASVSQSLQNAIASGDWDTLGEGIGNALAVSASAIVSDQITKSLSEGLTAESGLLAQAGAAFAGPLAGAVVGGAIQLAVRELGDYFSDDWDPTADRQASQGTGTVLGSIEAKSQSIARAVDVSATASEQLVGINTGMLRALQSVQAGISGATARVALGIGGVSIGGPSVQSGSEVFGPAAGALVGRIFGPASSLVGGALEDFGEFIFDTASDTLDFLTFGELNLDELLGGKSKKRDEGIQIVGGYLSDLIDETLVNAYATFRVKKHAFDDYDTKERMERLGGDVEQQFSLAFSSMFDSVEQAAAALGIDAEQRLANFQVDTQKLSLEGMNAEEQQAEIAAYFGTVFDGMADEVAPFLTDFQEAGEGLGETLARVATFTQVTQEAVNRLGVEFQDLTGRALVEASERLVEAAGGVDQFISSMQGFISNFASEAEQFALAQSDVTRALAQNNLSLPDTREAYYELLQAQDASTEAGAENVATLLRIQSAADAYYTYLEDQQDEATRQQERLADMQRRRNREIIQEQQQIVSGRLSEAQAAAGIVRSALDGLSLGTTSASEFARTSATARLQDIVATGAVPGTEDLRSLVNSATNIDMSQFATMADYATEVGRTGGLLGELDQITREQVTVEQRMLDTLERQVELQERGNQEQIQALVALQASVEDNAPVSARAQAVTTVSSATSTSGSSSDEVLRSMLDRIEKVNNSQLAIARHSQRTSRILERLERYGIEVRE